MSRLLNIERLCFPVTLRCNLRCRLCAEGSPYYNKPYHPTIDELREEVRAFFQVVGHVSKFDITGGEPFLRSDLSDFISWMFENYQNCFDVLRVTTNGSIQIPNEFVEAVKGIRREQFYVIVDNYGHGISKKAEENAEKLKKSGIRYDLRDYFNELHCEGWVDYGDFSLKHDDFAAMALYERCMVPKLGFFTCLVNGKLFPCAKARLLYEQGLSDVFVDLYDKNLTIIDKQEQMMVILGEATVDVCKYCNGLCNDGPRFFPAEQLIM
ncbi:hypothetical protein SDC9_44028 [bioreactor metagenome]|uniref:Radical SAM core domain-containing protein n=1 Tax=bioreactor metagenome TaxID=1076179 RepID=A0A644W5Z3_9ZZZZ